jgi:hypothetical protein
MTDASIEKPSELRLDTATGLFTLENDATIKTVYTVDLQISSSDGVNE